MKRTFGFAACDGCGLRLLCVACYVVQPCMHTVIIGANRRPRRVQTHEASQEDETVVSDEEGAKMKLFRTGTNKVSSCELCNTFRLHLCTILGHLKSICSFAVENEFLRGSCLESKGFSLWSARRIHDVGRCSYF
jgi:hypothetical protein